MHSVSPGPPDSRPSLAIEDDYLIDLPRPDPRPGRSYDPPRPDWTAIYGENRPLRIEIGVGKSEFLIELAAREPGFNYLGFEYDRDRVRRFLRKVRRAGVENIRMICRDARPLLPRIVDEGSVDHFFLLFPDPWPKNRHAKHRFVRPENVALLHSLLRPGGGFTLRTDAPPYAYQMLGVLEASGLFENLSSRPGFFSPEPRLPIRTLFQRRWEEEGRAIFYLEYRARSAPES